MNVDYSREDKNDHEILLKVEIPAEAIEESYQQLLKDRSESMNLKGFRQGKVPSDMIEPQLEQLLLAETFERIAPYYVNAALIKEKIQPIAPPAYSDLEELAKGKPAKFNVTVTVLPEYKLPDISKIKVEEEKPDVTEEELEKTLETMMKNNLEGDGKKTQKIDDKWAKEIAKKYNFEDVKTLADLKEKLSEMIMQQKQSVIDQNIATNVIQEVIKAANIEVPQAAINYEAEQREEAFMQDLKQMNMSLKDFLDERGITHEQLKEMWRKDSQEALENDIILRVYARDRDLELPDEELKKEVEQIKKSAKAQYEMEHAGHDHESHFDETIYDDPQWQEQIRNYILKQKAFRELIIEVIGYFPGERPPESEPDKKPANKKKSTNKSKK